MSAIVTILRDTDERHRSYGPFSAFHLLCFPDSAGPVVEAHGRLFDARCCTTLLKHRLDRTVEVVHRDKVLLEVWPVNSAFRFLFLACRSIAREHVYAARDAEK